MVRAASYNYWRVSLVFKKNETVIPAFGEMKCLSLSQCLEMRSSSNNTLLALLPSPEKWVRTEREMLNLSGYSGPPPTVGFHLSKGASRLCPQIWFLVLATSSEICQVIFNCECSWAHAEYTSRSAQYLQSASKYLLLCERSFMLDWEVYKLGP